MSTSQLSPGDVLAPSVEDGRAVDDEDTVGRQLGQTVTTDTHFVP
jgi:hypothetical protein